MFLILMIDKMLTVLKGGCFCNSGGSRRVRHRFPHFKNIPSRGTGRFYFLT
jgi:hypothetical protein